MALELEAVFIAFTDARNIRNNDCGDWHNQNGGVRCVETLRMANLLDSYAVAIHEMVEQFFCLRDGITDEMVTAYDSNPVGVCPYERQHEKATLVEKAFVKAADESWAAYEQRLEEVFEAIDAAIKPE
jgi:hypothetical protein